LTELRATRLFDGEQFAENATVVFDGAAVRAVRAGDASGPALPADWLLVPGFVDLQVNGGGGVLFNDATDSDALRVIADAHARRGTTALLPTLISDRTRFAAALDAVSDAVTRGVAGIVGLHLEGPFINPARRGIHPAARLGTPDASDLELLSRPRPWPLLVTLAPELVGDAVIAGLATAGVRVFIGHSDASFEQAIAGLAAGAVGFTHLFNAMSQFGSRAPGCVGAAMAHEAACAGIICDGLHAHPASVRLAWRLLGPDRLILVSDAMPTAASDAVSYVWCGQTITLDAGRLALPDGTLAGAHLTMAEAVANAVRLCGIPLADALRMATATPARVMGLSRHGRIDAGSRADVVALDQSLRVAAVWQAGRRIV
jgi:N-acetylglucosamine-6-phosphate deacetylase